MRSVVVVALLVLGAGACGIDPPTVSKLHTCALPGAPWVSEPSPEAGVATAAKLSCPGSITDYCSKYAISCPPSTWAEVIAEQNATGEPSQLTVCDAYNWATVGWACGSEGLNGVEFAYDKTTGKLLAAVELSAPGAPDQQVCLAGPTTVSQLGSCTAYYDCFPNDAGLPRGHCYGDGGVAGSLDGG